MSSSSSSLVLQLPKQVLAAIAEATNVTSAANDAKALILSNAYAPEGKDTDALNATTAIAMVFAHGLRLALDKSLFAELLSGTVLASDRADALVEVYASLVAATGADNAAIKAQQQLAFQRLVDGPLNRITGMKWSMGHKLGNRAQDPPERSVPVFYFTFTTAGAGGVGEGTPIEITATQEQAQELLVTFRDMVKEGERLSK